MICINSKIEDIQEESDEHTQNLCRLWLRKNRIETYDRGRSPLEV